MEGAKSFWGCDIYMTLFFIQVVISCYGKKWLRVSQLIGAIIFNDLWHKTQILLNICYYFGNNDYLFLVTTMASCLSITIVEIQTLAWGRPGNALVELISTSKFNQKQVVLSLKGFIIRSKISKSVVALWESSYLTYTHMAHTTKVNFSGKMVQTPTLMDLLQRENMIFILRLNQILLKLTFLKFISRGNTRFLTFIQFFPGVTYQQGLLRINSLFLHGRYFGTELLLVGYHSRLLHTQFLHSSQIFPCVFSLDAWKCLCCYNSSTNSIPANRTQCTAKKKSSTACTLMHSHCTKTPTRQTCGVWMTAWLEHAACQLQAVDQVFFAVMGYGKTLALIFFFFFVLQIAEYGLVEGMGFVYAFGMVIHSEQNAALLSRYMHEGDEPVCFEVGV
ncbi:hypothetical protein VP01_1288g3 [Puccinia sorghi]|uniref:Uncharacterized protein n=1 Tax=Puccinia sorghi TaxID=27349 RepID=A0A0L6VNF6_9BASI|nr:hypothetical protein VP01_1288g3 [Puccinia sorghi]